MGNRNGGSWACQINIKLQTRKQDLNNIINILGLQGFRFKQIDRFVDRKKN